MHRDARSLQPVAERARRVRARLDLAAQGRVLAAVDLDGPPDDAAEALSARLRTINDHFTYALYQNVCRSLFERDKLLFSFLLDCRIMGSEDRLPSDEFELLEQGPMSETWGDATIFIHRKLGAAEDEAALLPPPQPPPPVAP